MVEGLESFQVGEHVHTSGVTHPNFTGTAVPGLGASSDVSLHLGAHLYLLSCLNKLVNVSVSLSCVSSSSK